METDEQKGYAVESSISERVDDRIELGRWSDVGGTDTDAHEMRILGRVQQLNVWKPRSHWPDASD